ELALCVVIADAAEQIEQDLGRAERHDFGIAQGERALLVARIFLLADCCETSPIVEQETSIANKIGCLEADHHQIGARLELGAHAVEGFGSQEGCITIKHEDAALESFERFPGGLNRVSCPKLFRLHE